MEGSSESHPTVYKRDHSFIPPIPEGPNFKCRICNKVGEYGKIVAHLQSHRLTALEHGDYTMYRCNGQCIKSSHFHCCFCGESRTPQAIAKHLKSCAEHPQHSSDMPSPCPASAAYRGPSTASRPVCDVSTMASTASPVPATASPACNAYTASPDSSAAYTALKVPGSPAEFTAARDPAPASARPLASKVSRVVQSMPKTTTCPHCNTNLLKKNLKTHIERRHSSSVVEITATHHLPSQCLDSKKGIFAVARTSSGLRNPHTKSHLKQTRPELFQKVRSTDSNKFETFTQSDPQGHSTDDNLYPPEGAALTSLISYLLNNKKMPSVLPKDVCSPLKVQTLTKEMCPRTARDVGFVDNSIGIKSGQRGCTTLMTTLSCHSIFAFS